MIDGRVICDVEVDTYQVALDLCDEPLPNNEHQAKFSLRHCAAIALLDGNVGFSSFDGDAIRRARDIVGRTTVRATENFTAAYPQAWGAEVRVALEGGDKLVQHRTHAKGDPEAPMSRGEIIAKAESLFRLGGVVEPVDLSAAVLNMVHGAPAPGILGA